MVCVDFVDSARGLADNLHAKLFADARICHRRNERVSQGMKRQPTQVMARLSLCFADEFALHSGARHEPCEASAYVRRRLAFKLLQDVSLSGCFCL